MSKRRFSSVFSDLGSICWVINPKFYYVEQGKIFDRLKGAQVFIPRILQILSVCLSFCLFVFRSACLTVQYVFLSVCLSVCISYLYICTSERGRYIYTVKKVGRNPYLVLVAFCFHVFQLFKSVQFCCENLICIFYVSHPVILLTIMYVVYIAKFIY